MRPAGWRGPARALVSVVAAMSACTPARYSADADREVGGILEDYQERALAGRASAVKMPEPPKIDAAPAAVPEVSTNPAPPAGPVVPTPPMQLDLKRSLATAMHQSRDFQTQREGLYFAGLGFTLTQFDYGPKFNAAVSALWGKSEDAARTDSYGGTFGVTQLLPTNGQVSFSSGLTRSVTVGQSAGVADWSSNLALNLTQPLLRGFGNDQYREAMTQAERSLIYSVRGFELFREQFVIEIAQSYFALVSAKKQLVIQEDQLAQAEADLEKNVALRAVDRKRDQDVILAKRQRIAVEQRVLNARTDYRRQVERFLVDLGLDPKAPAEIVEDEPPFEPVAFDPESVVKVALVNHLDVQTRREQLQDQERQLELQKQSFLPDLGLTASAGLGGAGDALRNASPDRWNRAAGLSLNIPLQQINERNAWRRSEIQLDEARRNWDQFLDDLRNGLQSDLRALTNLEKQIQLDHEKIDDEQKNVERLALLQSNGEVSSRDLLESRQSLVDAQNQLIADLATHFIARLNFFKNVGLLFVDDEGRWNIGAPVPENGK